MSLPGWNSVASVGRLASFFEVAGIVVLGLLVVTEVLAFLYGHREKELHEARNAPRTLTAVQSQVLVAVLGRFPAMKVSVQYSAGDAEAGEFASQLVKAFKAGHADTAEAGGYLSLGASQRTGLAFIVHSQTQVPPGVVELLLAAREAGLAFTTEADPSVPVGTLKLFVGHKE